MRSAAVHHRQRGASEEREAMVERAQSVLAYGDRLADRRLVSNKRQ
jgi:hypothetical protein